MTFQNYRTNAGAESVYAILGGIPQLRTSAEFAAGFRERAETEIERLIALLDVLDADDEREPDADDEPSLSRNEWTGAFEPANMLHDYGTRAWLGGGGDDREHDAGEAAENDIDLSEGDEDPDNEASLGWANPMELRSQSCIDHDCRQQGAVEGEVDAGENPEEEEGEREPDVDAEPSLGWRCGWNINQARPDLGQGVIDGEIDAGEEPEPLDYEAGYSGPLSEVERTAVRMVRQRATALGRRPLRDPDLCTIIRPGMAILRAWS